MYIKGNEEISGVNETFFFSHKENSEQAAHARGAVY